MIILNSKNISFNEIVATPSFDTLYIPKLEVKMELVRTFKKVFPSNIKNIFNRTKNHVCLEFSQPWEHIREK